MADWVRVKVDFLDSDIIVHALSMTQHAPIAALWVFTKAGKRKASTFEVSNSVVGGAAMRLGLQPEDLLEGLKALARAGFIKLYARCVKVVDWKQHQSRYMHDNPGEEIPEKDRGSILIEGRNNGALSISMEADAQKIQSKEPSLEHIDEARQVLEYWNRFGKHPSDRTGTKKTTLHLIALHVERHSLEEVIKAVENIHNDVDDVQFLPYVENAFGGLDKIGPYYGEWQPGPSGKPKTAKESAQAEKDRKADEAFKRRLRTKPRNLSRYCKHTWAESVKRMRKTMGTEWVESYVADLTVLGERRETMFFDAANQYFRSVVLGRHDEIVECIPGIEELDIRVLHPPTD